MFIINFLRGDSLEIFSNDDTQTNNYHFSRIYFRATPLCLYFYFFSTKILWLTPQFFIAQIDNLCYNFKSPLLWRGGFGGEAQRKPSLVKITSLRGFGFSCCYFSVALCVFSGELCERKITQRTAERNLKRATELHK